GADGVARHTHLQRSGGDGGAAHGPALPGNRPRPHAFQSELSGGRTARRAGSEGSEGLMAPLFEVRDLRAHYHTRRGIVRAVDGISFSIERGQTLGIVGESGSGKSVTQLSILGLLPSPPLKIEGGQARFPGTDLLTASPKELRKIRGDKISMIFQEPMTSLNPYLKIGTQLIEPLTEHRSLSKKEAWGKAIHA